jgi:hypothetical protein
MTRRNVMTHLSFILAALTALAPAAYAQNLTGAGASVHDSAGTLRSDGSRTGSFTTAESVTLRQSVTNSVTSLNSITFTFKIKNPAGAEVFSHSGNSAPGTAGTAQTQLAGIAISSFYSAPGNYTFVGTASLDAETVTQQAAFMISSPNITLIYPPYGARGLSDKPLTFRWTASGATRYRVTVSDNAGLYNPMHTALNAGENSYSYPDSPSEPRAQMVPDQVYYWKVEGLDGSNNRISESSVYNFSMKSQASTRTRNVSMTALALSAPVLDFEKPVNMKATLYNGGSVTESNISVKLSLGGIAAADSPKQVVTIAPGEKQELSFTAFMPQGQEQGLAVACADLFDDNIPDNCRTMLLSKSTGDAASTKPKKKLSYDEMFQEIIKRLGPEAAKALEGYTFESLSCAGCSQDDLAAVIAALISGEAQLVDASVLDAGGGAAAPPGAQARASASEAASEETGGDITESALDLAPVRHETPGEWTGFMEAPDPKAPAFFVVRDRKEWKKVWALLSPDEDYPEVDFGSKMVVGIVAAPQDNAEAVRILGRRKTEDGMAFDYYVIQAAEGQKPALSAYIFKLYDRAEDKADFKRLDVKR